MAAKAKAQKNAEGTRSHGQILGHAPRIGQGQQKMTGEYRGMAAMWGHPKANGSCVGGIGDSSGAGLDMTWGMVEQSIDDPDFCSGVKVFDRLQPNQKLALLALVGKALKDEGEPSPELTAHTEATVGRRSSARSPTKWLSRSTWPPTPNQARTRCSGEGLSWRHTARQRNKTVPKCRPSQGRRMSTSRGLVGQ